MADEVRVTAALEVSNGNFSLPKIGNAQLKFDQDVPGGGVPGTLTVAVAGQDVDLSGLSALGWLWMRNLNEDNFVQFGPKSGGTFYPIGRMEPGEPALFRLEDGATLHLKADTADCLVQVLANED